MMSIEDPNVVKRPKGISKNKRGAPKVSMPKFARTRTKSTAAKEWSQPRSKYTKTIKYYNEYRPR